MEGSLVAYKVFTNGSTLQASELNENLMQQSVATFSNAAARTAAITSPVEGQLTYLEDTNEYASWNGSAWVSPFGLTLVKSQTIGTAATSVTVNDAFNANYDAYKIIITGGVCSESTDFSLQLGDSVLSYFYTYLHATYDNTAKSAGAADQSAWRYIGGGGTDQIHTSLELINPFLAKRTSLVNASFNYPGAYAGVTNGFHSAATSFTSFKINVTSGNITGGTINVYGYRKA
jgi:hypothetical protein